MQAFLWLKIQASNDRWGWRAGHCSVTKSKPTTHANEIALKLDITIPDSYFEKPQLTAKLSIPEPAPDAEIETSVRDGIAEAIEEQTGLKVHLTYDKAEEQLQ